MPESLGSVSFPSGDLLVIDFGLLRAWCGEPAEGTDFEITGPDAAEVAGRLDLAMVKGRYAFDFPDGDPLAKRVDGFGLDASLVRIPKVPHHARVQRLLADAPGGVEVPFPAGWAVAVRGVPADRELPVHGVRMDPDGPDAGRWRSVWVECAEGEPARSVECGYVLVEEARLMFADPAALTGWRNDEPHDGLFDLVFWGRDATAVAERLSAPALDQDTFGWTDLTKAELASHYSRLRAEDEAKFHTDVRPHDDHHRLLSRMRGAPTESGVVEVGGALMTGWYTSWGDGAYPVHRDLAEDGTLLRVRVELGAEEIVRRQRRFERLWFGDLAQLAIVSNRVARDGEPAGWLYREGPDNERDSGWRVFAGDEPEEYVDDVGNCSLVPLRELISADPRVEAVLTTPAPAAFERRDDEFVPVDR
ncbi:DUF2185 domain-containing protein [Actinophytocola sp. KF-1]